MEEVAELGYQPDASLVTRPLREGETIASALYGHSERLAIAWNFVEKPGTERIQVATNLRMCTDCRKWRCLFWCAHGCLCRLFLCRCRDQADRPSSSMWHHRTRCPSCAFFWETWGMFMWRLFLMWNKSISHWFIVQVCASNIFVWYGERHYHPHNARIKFFVEKRENLKHENRRCAKFILKWEGRVHFTSLLSLLSFLCVIRSCSSKSILNRSLPMKIGTTETTNELVTFPCLQ